MKRTKKHPHELSLRELLQEVQNRISTETIPADQQQSITQTMMNVLQACAKGVERPLPGQDMQEVRGQAHVKRAKEVAAAGGRNPLLVGPAGGYLATTCCGEVSAGRPTRASIPPRKARAAASETSQKQGSVAQSRLQADP